MAITEVNFPCYINWFLEFSPLDVSHFKFAFHLRKGTVWNCRKTVCGNTSQSHTLLSYVHQMETWTDYKVKCISSSYWWLISPRDTKSLFQSISLLFLPSVEWRAWRNMTVSLRNERQLEFRVIKKKEKPKKLPISWVWQTVLNKKHWTINHGWPDIIIPGTAVVHRLTRWRLWEKASRSAATAKATQKKISFGWFQFRRCLKSLEN